MCKDKPYFADAKVGDSVYCMLYGKGEIESIYPNSYYPIFVRFADLSCHSYSLQGTPQKDNGQTLFYSKTVFDLPPPPKRKIKKVIEGWVNIYPGSTYEWTSMIHATEAAANQVAMANRLGKAHFIRHEYEVEE